MELSHLSHANDDPTSPASHSPDRDRIHSPAPATMLALHDDKGRNSCFRDWARWWSQNINPVVIHTSQGPTGGDPRDYLALERTFLSWMRTSIALVSAGVVVAQLFILKDVNPTTGKGLGAVLSFSAIVTSLLGCLRYFRLQKQLILGKTETGSRLLTGYWVLFITLVTALFVIVLKEV